MSIVTFWDSRDEQNGKTMSVAAIATYMAIEHNYKILVVSTTNKEDILKRCFWEESKIKKNLGIFGPNASLEVENGVEGLARIIRSNKISPDIITNYTKVVFKDRLEILLGSNETAKEDDYTEGKIEDSYPEIISMANQYYDIILVDLDYNVDEEIQNKIINSSDIIVINTSQRISSIDILNEKRQENNLLQSKRAILMVSRYDRCAKYNIKNLTRYLGEKNQVLTVPYNTLFFEAAEESGVPDLFLRFKKSIDPEDRNAFFLSEVKRATESIVYRLQDLQMRM